MLIAVPDRNVEELADVLASLRFLPTHLGWQPFVLIYKQAPEWRVEAEPLSKPPKAQEDGNNKEVLECFTKGMHKCWDMA